MSVNEKSWISSVTLLKCECVPYIFAQIAQSVEQRTENPRVAGSIPALGIC